jgi:hypothetical protein
MARRSWLLDQKISKPYLSSIKKSGGCLKRFLQDCFLIFYLNPHHLMKILKTSPLMHQQQCNCFIPLRFVYDTVCFSSNSLRFYYKSLRFVFPNFWLMSRLVDPELELSCFFLFCLMMIMMTAINTIRNLKLSPIVEVNCSDTSHTSKEQRRIEIRGSPSRPRGKSYFSLELFNSRYEESIIESICNKFVNILFL